MIPVRDTTAVTIVGASNSTSGDPVRVSVNSDGQLQTEVGGPVSAFGEVLAVEPTPVFQTDFVYSNNPEVVGTTEQGGGAVTNSNGMAVCTAAASANSLASLRSRHILRYRDGQGASARFTAMWNAAAILDPAGASTTIGIGTAESGLFFGYVEGQGFCAIHNERNTREIQSLTIGTKSSDAQTAVITLAGVAYNVDVTNGADANQTAYEIATGVNYNATYPGWQAVAIGNIVYFLATTSGDKTGTFSAVFPTSGAGTFAEVVAGALTTTNLYPQTTWNVDKMDGTGPSGMTFDPSKINVFWVRYQYLGGGMLEFGIEDTETGKLLPVHKIKRAGASILPSLKNPAGPLQMSARNSTNDTAVGVSSASIAGFIEGKIKRLGVQRAYATTKASIGTTLTPLFTIKNNLIFNSKACASDLIPLEFRLASLSSGRSAIVEIYEGATLTPYANYTAVNAATSTALIDTTATGITGGVLKSALVVAGGSSASPLNIAQLGLTLEPGAYLTFAARADSSTVTLSYSLAWSEDQ